MTQQELMNHIRAHDQQRREIELKTKGYSDIFPVRKRVPEEEED